MTLWPSAAAHKWESPHPPCCQPVRDACANMYTIIICIDEVYIHAYLMHTSQLYAIKPKHEKHTFFTMKNLSLSFITEILKYYNWNMG